MEQVEVEAIKTPEVDEEVKETAKQAGKFSLVGIINTVIDLGLFNILVFLLGWDPVVSNIIAISAAIINSYFWNKLWTFGDKDTKHVAGQAIMFLLLSLIGMVLNTAVLKFLIDVWAVPGNLVVSLFHILGLSGIFNDEFVSVNFAKAIGLAVSMVWNFLTYKKFVFKK